MLSIGDVFRKAAFVVVPTVAIATLGTVTLLVVRGAVGVGPGSLSFLGMMAAGIVCGHISMLLGIRRSLSRDALTGRRSMLAAALGVLTLFGVVVLGPDYLGIGEEAWRRLGPLQPIIVFAVTAACGAFGALAMHFPWLRSDLGAAGDVDVPSDDTALLLATPGFDAISTPRQHSDERGRPEL